MMRIYAWSQAYATAVLEMDPVKLVDKILDAERAIRRRSQDPGLDYHELKAMGDASIALRNLLESRADLSSEDSRHIAAEEPG
jgi:hypothetical protein